MFYVYCILNILNKKRYVGKTDNVDLRLKSHKSVAFNKNSSSYSYPFYKAIRKYAKNLDDFDKIFIIDFILTYETEALAYEKFYINLYHTNISLFKNKALGYNLTEGGDGAKGLKWSNESKQKLSKSRKGIKLSESTKRKLQITSTGRKLTQESKDKIAKSKFGSKNPNYGKVTSNEVKKKISDALKGIPKGPMTAAHKNNISKSKIGKPGKSHSKETKIKLSLARQGENGPGAKLTWETVNEIRKIHKNGEMGYIKLSKKYKVSPSAIADIIKNRTWIHVELK